MKRKVIFFNKTVFLCGVEKLQMFDMESFGDDTGPQSFCHSFIALAIIRCSKRVQKFAVRVCGVATVITETTQMVLGQFKNFLSLSYHK